ncbi:MAG TPA: LysM peptidoglycan-binding domain-containing protein [Bradyrhizobium sp.]|nr:LysM peptidoglycan-binding domain-containing protein [Bradyrhizobium sp.]
MTATSMSRIVALSLALVAGGGAALFYGIRYVRHEPPVEARAATAAPAVAAPAPGAQEAAVAEDKSSAPLASAQAQVSGLMAALAPPPASDATDGTPSFDVARIESTGDAVIAGRAAPGATVELLRDGEPLDRAIADQSGQFVMTPTRLPPGSYELALRSRQPDGKQVTSKQTVKVALEPNPPQNPVALMTSVPSNVPENGLVTGSVPEQAASSERQQPNAASATAAASPDEGSPSAVTVPKIATTTVARGDSLWRISRVSYGAGTRYAVIYRANRKQIRNPDLIYPGQIFVVPAKER